VEVECLPGDIPPVIEVDVTLLDIGDSLRVRDLKVSPEVKVITHPEEIVVSVISPAREEVVETEEEEVSPEEVEVVGEKKEEEEEETEKKE
jgi:large subunit ribosomal protein L25